MMTKTNFRQAELEQRLSCFYRKNKMYLKTLLVLILPWVIPGFSYAQTVILNENYSSSAGWTQVTQPGSQGTVSITGGVCRFEKAEDHNRLAVYRQLSQPLDNTWRTDFEVTLDANQVDGANYASDHVLLGLTADSMDVFWIQDPATVNPTIFNANPDAFKTDQDGIMVLQGKNPATSLFSIIVKSGKAVVSNISTGFSPTLGTTYYMRLERLGSANGMLRIYSDAGRTILLNTTNFPIPACLAGLSYIQHSNDVGGESVSGAGITRRLSANIDNTIITDELPLRVGNIKPVISAVATSNVSCFSGNNGSATVNVINGTSPTYSYAWSNGTITANDNSLSAGVYNVTVTDNNGCSSSTSVTIMQPKVLTASISSGNVSCHGGNNGSATAVAAGGTPGYSYNWSNGASTATDNNLAFGGYSVTITDLNGCIANASVIITEPDVLTASALPINVSCHGANTGSTTVIAGGGTPIYNYSWSNGATTASISNLIAGSYNVTVTDGHGCQVTTSVNIIEPAALLADAGMPKVICYGGSTLIGGTPSASGGVSPYTYAWLPGTGLSSANVANPLASPSVTTNYSVFITDANGCTARSAVSVSVNPPISASITPPADNDRCHRNIQIFLGYGPQSTQLHASASGGSGSFTYSWSPASGLNNAGIANPTASPTATTTYTLTATDTKGCSTTASVVVNVLDVRCGEGLFKNQRVKICNTVHVNVAGVDILTKVDLCLDKLLVNTFLSVNPQACLGDCDPDNYVSVNLRKANPENLITEGQVKAYPNPFTDEVKIEVSSPREAETSIELIDMTGRTVASYKLGTIAAGETTFFTWNGMDGNEKPVVAGIYLCKVNMGDTMKLIRLSVQR